MLGSEIVFEFRQQWLSSSRFPPRITWLSQPEENVNSILWLEVTGNIKNNSSLSRTALQIRLVCSSKRKQDSVKTKQENLFMVSKQVQELSGRNKKQGGSQLHTTILSNKIYMEVLY